MNDHQVTMKIEVHWEESTGLWVSRFIEHDVVIAFALGQHTSDAVGNLVMQAPVMGRLGIDRIKIVNRN